MHRWQTLHVSAAFTEPNASPLAALLQVKSADLLSERGVSCPGDLPSPSDPHLVERARMAKAALGSSVFVLGHHYQRDEVIQFADVTGDSFKLAQSAAASPQSQCRLFDGRHGELRTSKRRLDVV